MRPPEFTGGNTVGVHFEPRPAPNASMRPPEFTGGNDKKDYDVLREAVKLQ